MLTFQNLQKPQIWQEISKLTEVLKLPESSLTEEQDFYMKMFQHISYEVQHKILLLTANMENSLDHCRLILLLMKRFPQAIPQHARCLLETLIAGIDSPTAPQYKDMLINEALPLILQKPPELPSNLLHLIVRITIEHYVERIYGRMSDEKYVVECWRKIFETLEMCGRLLKWEKFLTFSRSYGKDDYWTRLVQIVGSAAASPTAANRDSKQISFTCIVVFLYSLQEYMSNVSGRAEKATTTTDGVSAGGGGGGRPEFLLVESLRDFSAVPPKRRHSDAFNQDSIKILVSEPCHPETPKCLITAAHCWQLLNSNELLQMESNQLLGRLPLRDWIARFISDLSVYLGRAEDFQAILKAAPLPDGLEKDMKLLSLAVLQNNLGTQSVGPLIVSIMKELAQSYATTEIPQGEYLKDVSAPAGNGRNLILLLPMTKRAILQYCVRILISKLHARMQNLMTEPSDAALGYLLVLLQLNWPNPSGMTVAAHIFNLITTKRAFTFLPFSKYIILTDFIEEFAYLWSQQGGEVNLELTGNAKARHSFGTRRADKGVKDDFKQVLRDQIQRSNEDVDFLIIMFILQEHSQVFNEIPL